jgi:hypothetical protein
MLGAKYMYSLIPSQYPGEGEVCLFHRSPNMDPAYTSVPAMLQTGALRLLDAVARRPPLYRWLPTLRCPRLRLHVAVTVPTAVTAC